MNWFDLMQIVTALSTAVAAVFVGIQIRYQTRQQKLECLTKLHDELLAPSMQEALRAVHQMSAEEVANPHCVEDLEHIERIANTFDLLGFRVRRKAVPQYDALET